MFGEQRTRTLLGPADPVRDRAVAPPRLSARDLIARAEAAVEPVPGPRHARPRRWLVLAAVAGAVAVATGAAVVVHTFGASTVDKQQFAGPPPGTGTVLVPVAYQYGPGAPPAGDQLRALAARLVDAPYDNHAGRYTYHHTKVWGDPVVGYGPYVMGIASEQQIWQAADGTGRQSTRQLEPQYPDQKSRDYWQRNLKNGAIDATSAPNSYPLPPQDLPPLPSDRARLRELLDVQYGAGAVPKMLAMVYGQYAVPRQTRAEILRILADVPGFVWRGAVTDRAGRPGVAITFDDPEHGQQQLLVFDPDTGALLAQELLTLTPHRISTYLLILATDRTDQLG
jgi:hypothetical protein